MNAKIKPIIFVVVISVIGYGILYLMKGQRQTRAADSIYFSMQERMLPSGRILRKVVEERRGEWIKTATLLDRNGTIVQTKTATMSPDVCRKVEQGVFVADLWSDCSIDY